MIPFKRHTFSAMAVIMLLVLTVFFYQWAYRQGLFLYSLLEIATKPFSAIIAKNGATSDQTSNPVRFSSTPEKTEEEEVVDFTHSPQIADIDIADASKSSQNPVRTQHFSVDLEDPKVPPKPPQEQPTRADPKEVAPGPPQKSAEEILQIGRQLYEDGLNVPRLRANWQPDTIKSLIANDSAVLIAKTGDNKYRVIHQSGNIFEAGEFVLLTEDFSRYLSNRSIALNRVKRGGAYRDTQLRPYFKAMENHFERSFGTKQPVVFHLFIADRYDRYLAAKQFGAVSDLGLDLEQLSRSKTKVVTIGNFKTRPGKPPAYLISAIQIEESRLLPWNDPEALHY